MNKKAVLNLAELLENLPPERDAGFNMSWYVWNEKDVQSPVYSIGPPPTNVSHSCGTVACIAGWTCLALTYGGEILPQNRSSEAVARFTRDVSGTGSEHYTAAEVLGLSREQADELFTPMDTENLRMRNRKWDRVKPRHAATVLRHLAETGEVDWSVAFRRPKRAEATIDPLPPIDLSATFSSPAQTTPSSRLTLDQG